uniref:BESS domain-containing protein n=1 Tax=Bactrocera latifrons TaxID=174628 RepID=A0A0K8VEP8_BACLA
MEGYIYHCRRERIEVRTTGIPSLWEHYDEMHSLITEYENDRRNSLDIDHSNAKKIKFDHGKRLLTPEKNHNTRRDSKTSCNDNNFDTLSESDNSVEKNVGHNGGDVAESNNYSISVRKNLKSTKSPVWDNYSSKVQNTNRSIVVETNGYDDMDLFFLSMAKTVKKLPLHLQVHLKRKICNLVFEAELKELKPSNVDGNDL